MKCSNCGEEINDGIKFCPNCGVNLEKQTLDSAADLEKQTLDGIVDLEKPKCPERIR